MNPRAVGTLVAAVMALVVVGRLSAQESPGRGRLTLSKSDQAALAALHVAGKTRATLLIVAPTEKTRGVEEALRRRQCLIKAVASEIGYIRCSAPLQRLAELMQVSDIEHVAISTTQLSTFYGVASGTLVGAAVPAQRCEAPSSSMDLENPYTGAQGFAELPFKRAHPTYDGRGVVVGLFEPQLDVTTPELRFGRDLRGRRVPKVMDWNWRTDWGEALPELPDWMWREAFGVGEPYMRARVPQSVVTTDLVRVVHDSTGEVGGVMFRLPSVSSAETRRWRFGVLDPARQQFQDRPFDTNLDGAVDSLDAYPVLYDVGAQRVWLDLNHNHDFRDDRSLGDYSLTREVGVITPPTGVDTLGGRTFYVHVEAGHPHVWIELVAYDHGDKSASVLAGENFMGSQADGVAPGTRFVIESGAGGFTHEYIESWLEAFRDRHTDALTLTGGDDVRPTDGTHILDLLMARMIQVYGKPIFVAAGNSGSWLGFLSSPSVAPKAFSIGAYTPVGAWRANFGFTPSEPATLAPYSAKGPTDDGRLKPDILGVTGTLATTPKYVRQDLSNACYTMPKGYGLSGGTSAAAPTATGAAALLISGAKQTGLRYDLARLRTALLSTARFLPGVEARAQGNGVIQVDKAWEALQMLQSPLWAPVDIVSDAPVRTATSHRLRRPNRGVGIYEQEGWKPHVESVRHIAFRRLNGPSAPVTYNLRWKGDVGVFTSPGTLQLPLGSQVGLPVRIRPGKPGVYSAILDLIDPGTGLLAYQTLNTIVVPYVLESGNGYSVAVQGKAPRPGNADVFVTVPEGTQALQARATLTGCAARLEAMDPSRRQPLRIGGWLPSVSLLEASKDGEVETAFDDPMPGVWHFVISNLQDVFAYDARRADSLRACDFRLHVRALGVNVDETMRPVKAGDQTPLRIANRLADAELRIEGIGLATTRTEQIVLAAGSDEVMYEVEVPKGADKLEVLIDPLPGQVGDVDLYLFNATDTTPPHLAGTGTRGGARERVQVQNPAAGKWKVLIVPHELPQGSIRLNYRDLVYHEIFGRVQTTATTFRADVRTRPVGNRTLVAAVGAFTDNLEVTTWDPTAPKPSLESWPAHATPQTKRMAIPIQVVLFPVR